MSLILFLLCPEPGGPGAQIQEVVVVPRSNQIPVLDADVGSFPLLFLGSSAGRGEGGVRLLLVAAIYISRRFKIRLCSISDPGGRGRGQRGRMESVAEVSAQ